MNSTSYDSTAFNLMEVAVGDLRNRNVVVNSPEWTPPAGRQYFVSVLRYPEDLRIHLANTHNASGNPTVAGYAGPACAPVLWLDFDNKLDPEQALTDARVLVVNLLGMGVPPAAIRTIFSGNKGLHVEVDGRVFGGLGPAPAPTLARRARRLAEHVIAGLGLTTVDWGVYTATQLWRPAGSLHAGSGLYAIPLTLDELDRLDMDAIRSLAEGAHMLPAPVWQQPEAVPALARMWQQVCDEPESPAGGDAALLTEPVAPPDGEVWERGVGLAVRMLPADGRHEVLLPLAGVLTRAGWQPADTCRFISEVMITGMGQEGQQRVREGEARRLAHDTARNLHDGKPVVARTRLAQLVGAGQVIALEDMLGLVARVDLGDEPDAIEDQDGLPPFPIDALPGPADRLVRDGAVALGCPPDAIALPLLAISGAVIGNRYPLRLKNAYRVYPVLWTVPVMPPGTGKSPALKLARSPADILQREASDRYREELAAHDAVVAAREKKGRKDTDIVTPAPPRPAMEHFYSSDATLEAVAAMLSGGSPGIVLIHDEALAFIGMMDMYRGGRGADRERYMALWSSDQLKVDRKGAEPIIVRHPVVAFCGGLQPDRLTELTADHGRRDGFLERFLIAIPECPATRWREDDVAPETIAAVAEVYGQLRLGDAGEVVLSAAAKVLWVSWFDQNAEQTRTATGLTAGFYAKLDQQLARLALVLHCLERPDGPHRYELSVETLGAAIRIAEYFRAHAHVVIARFAAAGANPRDGLRTRMLAALAAAGGDWCSTRQLYAALGGHVPAEELQAVLAELTDGGIIDSEPGDGARGGRRGKRWRLRTVEEQPRASEQTEQSQPVHPAGCACSPCSNARQQRTGDVNGGDRLTDTAAAVLEPAMPHSTPPGVPLAGSTATPALAAGLGSESSAKGAPLAVGPTGSRMLGLATGTGDAAPSPTTSLHDRQSVPEVDAACCQVYHCGRPVSGSPADRDGFCSTHARRAQLLSLAAMQDDEARRDARVMAYICTDEQVEERIRDLTIQMLTRW